MIGNEINCLKNVGPVQLSKATSSCQSLDANQILPRSKQESDDLVSALLSLDLSSENGKILVSIDMHRTKEGWFDSAGQLINFFYWLPNEPADNLNYAGFRVDAVNETARWDDYNGNEELNLVCIKTAGHGKNNSIQLGTRYLAPRLSCRFLVI